MALTVETGEGLADADSYLSVAELKSYADARGLSYGGSTDTAIEQALRRGTRYVDGRYRSRFLGFRTRGRDQALEWPRQGVVVADLNLVGGVDLGWAIGPNTIPRELIAAAAEASIRELVSPGSLTPDHTPSERIVSETVGPISTTYANMDMTRPVVTIIDELLAPLLSRTSAYSGSLVRA